MADDTKNEKNEETTETAEVQAPKKGPNLTLILGIVVIVLLLGGGGAAFYFFGMAPAAAEGEEGEEVEVEEITETDIYFTGFNSNVVNLAVSDEYDFMYLKYGFDLEVSDQAVIAEMSTKLPRLTGVISRTMGNQDYTEICTPLGHDRLVRDVLRELNEQLESGTVIGVHFHTFVAQ